MVTNQQQIKFDVLVEPSKTMNEKTQKDCHLQPEISQPLEKLRSFKMKKRDINARIIITF